jgi:Mce-associated membrane protein
VTVDLYDVLDVHREASDADIRAAWKTAIADLDPSDRRFRAYNQAAEVLLDPDKRAAYDAELANREEDPAPGQTTETAVDHEPAPAAAPAGERTGRTPAAALSGLRRRLARPRSDTAATPTGTSPRSLPVWLPIVLLALTIAFGATAAWILSQTPSDDTVARALRTAEGTAQTAAPVIFSYDYRRLEESRDRATAYLTPDYRQKYDDLFTTVIEQNAPRLKTTVESEFLSSGIVRTAGGDQADDRVQVLVVFDMITTNRQVTEPRRSPAYAVLTMERVGDDWLVDDVEGPQVPQ